ncbi:bleomycin resistance protein [Spongisporangium articulatum]|uniref:Bleomycin resistance protein n=1 Tax=Spongisporangium articulatum TaxID=3362603 RepID=A0ABW8ATI9_9ACTN
MTTEANSTDHDAEYLRCGCCGRERLANRVTELDSSPGIYICLGCALSAARRVSRLPVPSLDPRGLLHRLQHLLPGGPGHSHAHQGVPTYGIAIPIFPVTDLNRSLPYYRRLGFKVVEHLNDYAVLASGDIELHLNEASDRTPDEAFIHVTGDPTSLWKRLSDRNLPGLGPVQDQPWGLREFVATDPDGNTLRIGHPSPS